MPVARQPSVNHKKQNASSSATRGGLANLFGVEMWERFSFYGMQALVLLYMHYSVSEGGLEIPKAAATSIVGAYGGLVYMACLLASLVADRVLGAERTLYYSAIMVMLGHLALAFIPAVTGLAIGLVLIAVGSGGVKTTAQVVLGALYSRDDPRRDGGSSIFYMGVNIGALFGPLITTLLWGWQGFHWGFGIAAVGMFFGLVQYTLMRGSTIKEAGHEVPNPVSRQQLMMALAVLAVIVVVCVWLIASGVLFFGIFQQQFTVLTIYSDMRLDRHIFGIEIPPSMVQLINPIFIVIFSSVFALIWTKLGDHQWSTPTKFGIANVIIGVSLFFFLPFSGGGPNSTPMFAIIWILFLFTMGELMLSPVGNSLAAKVAPEAFPSRMMAVWMMAVAMGTSLAGTLAGFYNPDDDGAENTFFITLGIVSIALGVSLLALAKWVVSKFATFR